jgi:hypothetical protein
MSLQQVIRGKKWQVHIQQLKLELIGTGEQAGTWGTTTNTNLGDGTLKQAIVGKPT